MQTIKGVMVLGHLSVKPILIPARGLDNLGYYRSLRWS